MTTRPPHLSVVQPDDDEAAKQALASALRTVEIETNGLGDLRAALAKELGPPFARAVAAIRAASGRVIVTGMGKSGHVGAKLAATLASTGTPAFFVHPSEASHGDLGMVVGDDVLIALSWSGETAELYNLIDYSRRFAVKLIAVTSRADSSLGSASDIVLTLPRIKEACPHGLAPTTSTIMQLALGDALAIALLEGRGFSASDFKVFHPGGQLGAKLRHVRDLMHGDDQLPLAPLDMVMADALVAMTQKRFGCLGIVDGNGKLAGIITDGDLRRNMRPDLLTCTVREIMTRDPKVVAPEVLAGAALEQLNSSNITAMFVVDAGIPIGIVHIHDLLRAGVA